MMLQYWHWVTFGLILIATEVMAPGAFFLWLGITAFMLGGIIFLFPFTSVSIQLVLFGIFAPLVTIVGRKIICHLSNSGVPLLLNRRGQQLVGQIITLDVPVVNGHAHVTVGDSKWRVKGPNLPAGVSVKVVGLEGNMLIVAAQDE